MTGRSGVLLLWLCGRPLWPAKNGSVCISCAPGPSESFQSRVIPITCYIKMDLILTISSTCHAELNLFSRIFTNPLCFWLILCGHRLWQLGFAKMGQFLSYAHQTQAKQLLPEAYRSPATSKWTSSWRSLSTCHTELSSLSRFHGNPIYVYVCFIGCIDLFDMYCFLLLVLMVTSLL